MSVQTLTLSFGDRACIEVADTTVTISTERQSQFRRVTFAYHAWGAPRQKRIEEVLTRATLRKSTSLTLCDHTFALVLQQGKVHITYAPSCT